MKNKKAANPVEKKWRQEVLKRTKDIYWHIGLKPHWVTIYKTHSKALAFAYTRPYIGASLPVRVIKYAQEYHVQIFDQKSPVVTHTFYPKDTHHHRTMRRKLQDYLM